MAGKLNLDPQKIVDKELDIDFKGYNPDQVDHLLDEIIQDYQTYENMHINSVCMHDENLDSSVLIAYKLDKTINFLKSNLKA